MMTPQEKRDQYRTIVEGIDKLIADGVQDGFQKTVSIGGVSFTYASLADLLKLRANTSANSRPWRPRSTM